MSWNKYVQACQELGFKKVTIINRKNFKPIAMTGDADVATSWTNKKGIKINENQELLNDWSGNIKTCVNGKLFHFYGREFDVIKRDEDEGKYIVSKNDTEVCFAYQFKSVWVVVYGKPSKATFAGMN